MLGFRFPLLAGALILSLLVTSASAAISPPRVQLASGGCDADGANQERTMIAEATVTTAIDIVLLFDLSQDTQRIVRLWKEQAAETIANVRTTLPGRDVRIAVAGVRDHKGYFKSCGYGQIYYELDAPAFEVFAAIGTSDEDVVAAIRGMPHLLGGGDGPEAYALGFWEVAQPDSGLELRQGAGTILVAFANNVPHDCDLTQGIDTGPRCRLLAPGTGRDPGRDGKIDTADDLDWHDDALASLRLAGVEIVLLYFGPRIERCVWPVWVHSVGGETAFFNLFGQMEEDKKTKKGKKMTAQAVEMIAGLASPPIEAQGKLELSLSEGCPLSLEVEPLEASESGARRFRQTFTLPAPLPEKPGLVKCQVLVKQGDETVATQAVEWSHGDMTPPEIDLSLEAVQDHGPDAGTFLSPTRWRRCVRFSARDDCPGELKLRATVGGKEVADGQLVQLRRPDDPHPELDSVLYVDTARLELRVRAEDAAGNSSKRMVGLARAVPHKR